MIDLLVAEIGSTTTVINAFDDLNSERPVRLGQGVAPTSVGKGDVNIGLNEARADLARRLGVKDIQSRDFFATSSAAGGLSMTVHGLVRDMTVRAAREAALGSGAVLRLVTAGRLRPFDLKKIEEADPRIIMIAGGVDYGERDTALSNFAAVAERMPRTPILYAGNVENRDEIRYMAEEAGLRLYVADNVYPAIDRLDIEPTRRIIRRIFEEHIVEAPGMARLREQVKGPVLSTPGAVMSMAEVMYEKWGDLMVIDVGGATTDVHSVTHGSEALRDLATSPEPFAKRSVEGDLGVFLNREHVLQAMTETERKAFEAQCPDGLSGIPEIPRTSAETELIRHLALTCVRVALDRHAGRLTEVFTPQGRVQLVRGKDLTQVKTLLLTGGALTRLGDFREQVKALIRRAPRERLYPSPDVNVMIDHDYLMASLGVTAVTAPQAAVRLLEQSVMRENPSA